MENNQNKEINKKHSISPIIIILGILAIALVIFALATRSKSAAPSAADRCLPATQAQLDFINAGIQAVDAGNSVREGWAVKSNDYENVYMVAAMIYGAGMEDGTGPGIWALGGDPENPNTALSVNGFAQNFTPFPDASQTDAEITQSSDGVEAVKGCFE
ncbi:MAG TPA: hypothetical protein PKD23_06875 [Bellilinea sp.]|nr:hypothetical protein [Bellilinea sp.]